MKIKSFEIHEFGILEKQEHSLYEGMSIFLGRNEAGKSTALEFFRTLLVGFPSSRLKKSKEGIFANKSKQMGGILALESVQAGDLKIERKANSFQVFNAEKGFIAENIYENLLSHVTRDIYSALYGFSLLELQTLQSLEDEDVKAMLYNASSGIDTFSLQYALTQIENTLTSKNNKSFLTNDSFKTFFKENCQRIEEINSEIKRNIQQNKEIDTLYEEAEIKEENMLALRNNKNARQSDLHYLQTKIQAWQVYSDWHLLLQKIQRIPEIAKNFPFNAKENMQELKQKISHVQEEIQKKTENRNILLEKIEKNAVNSQLVTKYQELANLIEYKSSYRNANNTLGLLEKNLLLNNEELEKQIKYLGENWTKERIEKLDLSLQTFEKIDEFYKDSEEFANTINEKERFILQLNKDIQLIEEEMLLLENKREELPKILHTLSNPYNVSISNRALLNEEYYEKLEDKNTKLQYFYTLLPMKRKILEESKAELEKKLQNYDFTLELDEAKIDFLLAGQDNALVLAKNMQRQEEKRKEHENTHNLLEKEINQKKQKNTEFLQELEFLSAQNLEDLIYAEKELEKFKKIKQEQIKQREQFFDSKKKIEENTAILAFSKKKIALLVFSALAALLSFTALCAKVFFDFTALSLLFLKENAFLVKNFQNIQAIPSFYELSLPFLSIAFLLFLFIVLSSFLNSSRLKAQKDLILAREKEEESKKNLQNLKNTLAPLYAFFALDKMPQDFFEVTKEEIDLEIQKAQKALLLEERIEENNKEISLLEEEFEKNLIFIANIQESYARSLKHWEEFFQSHGFNKALDPEYIFRDFARIEQIKKALQEIRKQEEEISALQDGVGETFSLIRELCSDFCLDIVGTVQKEEEALEILKGQISFLIKFYKEEEKIKENLMLLNENIHTYRIKKEKNLSLLVNAQEDLAQIKSQEKDFEEKYTEFLHTINFDEKLLPQAVKSRLQQASKCLELQKQIGKMLEEQSLNIEEMNKLSQPLVKILQDLSYTEEDLRNINYLEELDKLYSKAHDERQKEIERNKNSEDLALVEKALNFDKEQENLFLEKRAEELSSLCLENLEEFDFYSALADEYAEYKKEIQHIEDKLLFFARDKELTEFIQEFESVELASLKSSSLQLEEEIKEIQIQENEENALLAKLKAQIDLLENSSYLSEIKQEKTAIEEKNSKALENYMIYALAQSFIKKTKAEYEKEKQPELIKKASEIFSFITENKWQSITSSLDDNSLTLNPSSGSPLSPDKLSQGTKEQLYLALRLAYIVLANQAKESLPLLMDDILVNFDALRARQCAKTFDKILCEDNNQQILFFTCHEHIARLLQENVSKSKLYTIDKGLIY